MSNQSIRGARVLPRTLVKEVAADRRMTLICFGIMLLTAMGFVSVFSSLTAEGGFQSISALFAIPDAMVLIGSLFVTVCLFRIKQNPLEKIFKTAVIACAVYGVLQAANAYLRGVTLYTVTVGMENGEMGAVPEELKEMWHAYLPFNIWAVAVSVFRAGSFMLLSRAMNDFRMMTTGRYPDRHAALPASIVMSLTAGMVLCMLVLNLISGGDPVQSVLSCLTFLPELLFYFCASQLLRDSDLRRRGEK